MSLAKGVTFATLPKSGACKRLISPGHPWPGLASAGPQTADVAPVPGFVRDRVTVAARERQPESEAGGAARQPVEGGGVLETLDVVTKDGKARAVAALTFRLTGDKKLLKTIKEEHTNHSDSITGVLKTDLPETGKSFGTTIGNTSVGIGMVNPHGATDRPLPVLEVKEFEHTGVTCR